MKRRRARSKALGAAVLVGLGVDYGRIASSADHLARTADDDLAIVTIEKPREVNLLQLRGQSGRGEALFRIDGACHSMKVRFVAGDFGGERISIERTGAINIRISNSAIVRSLFAGRDLVSDEVVGGTRRETGDVDVVGLSRDAGFVINAGGSFYADVFGALTEPVSCDAIDLADRVFR